MTFERCVIDMTDDHRYRVTMVHYHYLWGMIPWGEYDKFVQIFDELEEAKYWVIQHMTGNKFTITDNVMNQLSYSDALKLNGKTDIVISGGSKKKRRRKR